MSRRGSLFIVSAPAGAGKTTLVDRLVRELPNTVRSISCTTRAPRAGEKEGRDYFFLTKSDFARKVQEGAFLEYAKVFDEEYGTSREFVEQELTKGHHVILVIDTQGALQLKVKQIQATYIFITAPSLEVLRERLIKRGTESPEKIKERLAWAEREIAESPKYDYHIVNDNLEEAYEKLKSIVVAEEQRRSL